MKKNFKSVKLASTVFGLAMFGLASNAMADNPFIQTYYSPDPAPVVFGDTLCSYSGNDEGGSFFTMHGWRVSCTTDMVNWTDMNTLILEAGDFNGSAKKNGDWAAQVIRRNNKYYYYVTVESTRGGRAINVAVSDKKEGPFKDALNGKHLAGPNWDYIDPTAWIDDDGQAYLYWGNPKLYYCPLKENMIECDGKEKVTDMASFKDKYTEGPWIHKRGKKYYMIYAAGGIPESIDYSWSDSPTGPWEYKGVIMPSAEPGAAFTVHSGIVDFKGRSFFFYHNQRRVAGAGGYSRTSAVEEFKWNPDGTIPTIRMTDDGVTTPIKNLDPYERVEAETKAWVGNITLDKSQKDDKGAAYTIIKNVGAENGCVYLTNMNEGFYTKVRSVDMSDGADKINVVTRGKGGKMELHLGSEKGTLLATMDIPASTAWEEHSFDVTGAEDVGDLYFVVKQGGFDFDYWYFESEKTAVPQEPFKGKAFAIPGIIQAEEFDKPGKGRGNQSFSDRDAENHGTSAFRAEDAPSVDLYKKGADSSRVVVGYIQKGEWLEYTVDVAEAGDYTMYAAVASDGGSNFSVSIDGEVAVEKFDVPAAKKEDETVQNFDDYAKVGANVKFSAGKHIVRITATSDWFDIDYFNFVKGKDADDDNPLGQETNHEQSIGSKVKFGTVSQDLVVFNMLGKKLGIVRLNGSSAAEALRMAGYNAGVYMLRGKGVNQMVNIAK
ncbi:family 43 glycosylhydrolase [Fibrobacter sp.]|uniref:family 43 glycosylhydrolase n=1 Tax=Fibrobacter sp. TaxID=35828 RepID=UPI00388FBDF8